MRLTNELLKSIVESERREMLQESRLRETIRRHIRLVLEAGTGGEAGGSPEVKGDVTSAVKTAAKTLGIPDDKMAVLVKAASSIKSGKRVEELPKDQILALAALGAELISSDPRETVNAANALKKVGEQPDKPQSGTDTGSSR